MARPKLGEGETQRLQLKISDEELTAIDDWRFANRSQSRSDAVRRLMKIGMVFDEGRAELVAGLRKHLEHQKELHRALVEEMTVSGRYQHSLDAVGLDLVKAIVDAQRDMTEFGFRIASIVRPVGIIKGEDGLSQEAEQNVREASALYDEASKRFASLSEDDNK